MILTCPACATRYRVAESEFDGSSGRTVRCANCGYLWHEPAPAAQFPDAVGSAAGPTRIEQAVSGKPPTEAAPPPLSRLEIPPQPEPRKPRVRSRAGRAATLGGVIIAAAIAGVFVRGHFQAEGPATAPLPAADQPTPAPGSPTGLIIRKVAPTRTTAGLVVDGEIANPGNVARDVPRLRMALRDSAGKEVQSQIVDPPKARLAPGEVVHFEAPFVHPPDAATGVVVTFASS